MKYDTAVVILLAAFLQPLCSSGANGAKCKRSFTTTVDHPDDCSTVTTPCYDYTNATYFTALEFPNLNTRTCYRTCHEWTDMYNPYKCDASLTGVHNQNLPSDNVSISATENIMSYTLISPNFNDPKDYRKSTICRYNVTCEDGELLAYNFMNHTLEDTADCDGNSATCVDYVQVTLLDSTISEKTCGSSAPVGQVIADGYSGVIVEFYANREEQAAGFKMNVMCYDSSINSSQLPTSRRKREAQVAECREVTTDVHREVDSVARLREALPSAQLDMSPENIDRCSEFTVRELEILKFNDQGTLTISRKREVEEVERVADHVTKLEVSTRVKVLHNPRKPIRGYAKVFVCRNTEGEIRAYVDRLGIKPEDRPTPEENELIFRLKLAVSQYEECSNFFDVYDLIDIEEEGGLYRKSECHSNYNSDRDLDRVARQYSTACNIFLRAAACTYRAVILKRPCSG